MPEYMVSIKIEKLEEGAYLATSDVLPGLVAEGRTIAETMEIAQDVSQEDHRALYRAWRSVATGDGSCIQHSKKRKDPCGCDLTAKLPVVTAE